MKDTLIYQTLMTFDKNELKKLRLFLQSPYFNQREDVIKLLDLYTQKQLEISDRSVIFKAIYPKEKFQDYKLRHISSFLLELIEQFWAFENTKNQLATHNIVAAERYRKRGLDKHFLRIVEENKKLLADAPYKNAEHFFLQHDNLMQEYLYNISERRNTSLTLQNIASQLDNGYFALKLRQACAALTQQTVYRTDYDLNMINEVIDTVEKHELYDIPAIGVYYFAYKYITIPNDDTYIYKFTDLLHHNALSFPAEEARDLYLLAINYCIKKHNEGTNTYLKLELDLYNEGLKNKILFTKGYISRFTFRNVVTLALTLSEYEWTADFLESQQQHIEPLHRIGTYNYCKARLAYEQKNYHEVFAALQQADYADVLITLAAKSLLLKVLYETDAHEALEAHLESMRLYIRRKGSILTYHQQNYLNLIRFTKKMLKSQFQKTALIALKKDIEQEKSLAEKKWLLEMLEKDL